MINDITKILKQSSSTLKYTLILDEFEIIKKPVHENNMEEK